MEKELKNEIMSHFSDVIDVENVKDNLYLLNRGDRSNLCLFDNEQKKHSILFDSFEEINTDLYLAKAFEGNYFINTKTLWTSSCFRNQKEIAPGVYIAAHPENRYDKKIISLLKCIEQTDWTWYSYPSENDVQGDYLFLLKEKRFGTDLVIIRLSDLKESGSFSLEFERKIDYLGDDFILLSHRSKPEIKALINKSSLCACNLYTTFDKFDKFDKYKLLEDGSYKFKLDKGWSVIINRETMQAGSFIKNRKPFRNGISIAETVDNCHILIRDSDNMESRPFVDHKQLMENILKLKRKEDDDDFFLFNLELFRERCISELVKITDILYLMKWASHSHILNIKTFTITKIEQTVKCEIENGVITCYSKAGSKSTLDENLVQSAFQF